MTDDIANTCQASFASYDTTQSMLDLWWGSDLCDILDYALLNKGNTHFSGTVPMNVRGA